MSQRRPIYLVAARTPYEIASTFLRFQEYYESPKFRGRYFSLEEFMDWYAAENSGFSYFDDWEGFNIPSWVFRPFREGRFDPLLKKERKLLSLIADVADPFYLIGACRPFALPNLKHEFVHGCFYTDRRYRAQVLAVLRKAKARTFHEALRRLGGYHPSRWPDEINAYSLAGIGHLVECGLNVAEAEPTRSALHATFRRHYGFSLWRANERKILELVHLVSLG
jgi:hypothetical protein